MPNAAAASDCAALKQVGQFFFAADDAHAASTAACRGFHDQGKSHAARPLQRFVRGGDDAIRARQNGHAFLLHSGARLFLLAHQPCDLRRRADELDTAVAADFGEVGILAQQSVTGMDGLNIGDFSSADDRRNVEIAIVETWRTDADGFVGESHMQRVTIGLAVNGDRLDAQLLAGTNHPQGDFPSIRNQDLFKHEINCAGICLG